MPDPSNPGLDHRPAPAALATESPRPASVTWLGHATVLVEVDGTRILTDPLLRPRFLHVLRRAAPVDLAGACSKIDAIVISHLHWDHADLASLRAVGRDTPVIVPRGAGALMRRAGLR
ncbi:MAG: MBL fold metallo-hydrolase, partial [Dehalococcoidia bacterium]